MGKDTGVQLTEEELKERIDARINLRLAELNLDGANVPKLMARLLELSETLGTMKKTFWKTVVATGVRHIITIVIAVWLFKHGYIPNIFGD